MMEYVTLSNGVQMPILGYGVYQVETHPYNQQVLAKEYMDKYGVQIEAWAPFGEDRGGLFGDSVLLEIGAKYQKTVAQVMLRWHIDIFVIMQYNAKQTFQNISFR